MIDPHKSYARLIGGAHVPLTNLPTVHSYIAARVDYVGLTNKNLTIQLIRGDVASDLSIIFDDDTLSRALSDISEAGSTGAGLNKVYVIVAEVDDARIRVRALDPTITEIRILHSGDSACPILGFHPYPHPQGQARELNILGANSSSENRALHSGGLLIRYEDRTTDAINRGLAHLSINSDDLRRDVSFSSVVTTSLQAVAYADTATGTFRASHVILPSENELCLRNEESVGYVDWVDAAYYDLATNVAQLDGAGLVYEFVARGTPLNSEPIHEIFKGVLAVVAGIRAGGVTALPPKTIKHDVFESFADNVAGEGTDRLEREAGKALGQTTFGWSYLCVGDGTTVATRNSVRGIASDPITSGNSSLGMNDAGDLYRADFIGTIVGPRYNVTGMGRAINHYTFMLDTPQTCLNIAHKGDVLVTAGGVFEIDEICPDLRTITVVPYSHDLRFFLLRPDLPEGFTSPLTLSPSQSSESAEIFVSHVFNNSNLTYALGREGLKATDDGNVGTYSNQRVRVRRYSKVAQTVDVTDKHRHAQYALLQSTIDVYAENLADSVGNNLRQLRAAIGVHGLEFMGDPSATGYTVYSGERAVSSRGSNQNPYLSVGAHKYNSFSAPNTEYRSYTGGPVRKQIGRGVAEAIQIVTNFGETHTLNMGSELRSALRDMVGSSANINRLDDALETFTGVVDFISKYINADELLQTRKVHAEIIALLLDVTAASHVYKTTASLDVGAGFRVELSAGHFSETDVGRLFLIEATDGSFTRQARMTTWGTPSIAEFIPTRGLTSSASRLVTITITPIQGFADTGFGALFTQYPPHSLEDASLYTSHSTIYETRSDLSADRVVTSYPRHANAISKVLLTAHAGKEHIEALTDARVALTAKPVSSLDTRGLISISDNVVSPREDIFDINHPFIGAGGISVSISGFLPYTFATKGLKDGHRWAVESPLSQVFEHSHQPSHAPITVTLTRDNVKTALGEILISRRWTSGVLRDNFITWLTAASVQYDVSALGMALATMPSLTDYVSSDTTFDLVPKVTKSNKQELSFEHKELFVSGECTTQPTPTLPPDSTDPVSLGTQNPLSTRVNVERLNVRDITIKGSSLVGDMSSPDGIGNISVPLVSADLTITYIVYLLASLHSLPESTRPNIKQYVLAPETVINVWTYLSIESSISIFEFELSASQLASIGVTINDGVRRYRLLANPASFTFGALPNDDTLGFCDAYDIFTSDYGVAPSANRYGTTDLPTPAGWGVMRVATSCTWVPITFSDSITAALVYPVWQSLDIPSIPVLRSITRGIVNVPNEELGRTLSPLINPITVPTSNSVTVFDDTSPYMVIKGVTSVGYESSALSGMTERRTIHALNEVKQRLNIANSWAKDESSHAFIVETDTKSKAGHVGDYGQELYYRGLAEIRLGGSEHALYISHSGFDESIDRLSALATQIGTYQSASMTNLWSVRHTPDPLNASASGVVFDNTAGNMSGVYPYSQISRLLPISEPIIGKFVDYYSWEPIEMGSIPAIRINSGGGFGLFITNASKHGTSFVEGDVAYLGDDSNPSRLRVVSDLDLRPASILTEGDTSISVLENGNTSYNNKMLALHSVGASLFRGPLKLTGDLPYTINSMMNLLPDKDLLSGIQGHLNPVYASRYHASSYSVRGNRDSLMVGTVTGLPSPVFSDYMSMSFGGETIEQFLSTEVSRIAQNSSPRANPELGERTASVRFSVSGIFAGADRETRKFASIAEAEQGYSAYPSMFQYKPPQEPDVFDPTQVSVGLLGVFTSSDDIMYLAGSRPLFSLGSSAVGRSIVLSYQTTDNYYGYFTGIITLLDDTTAEGVSIVGVKLSHPTFTDDQWKKFGLEALDSTQVWTDKLKDVGIVYLEDAATTIPERIEQSLLTFDASNSPLFPGTTGVKTVTVTGVIHGREWVLNAYQVNVSDRLFIKNELGDVTTSMFGDRNGDTTINGGRLNILNTEVYIPNLAIGLEDTYRADITCLMRKALRNRYTRDDTTYPPASDPNLQARLSAAIGAQITIDVATGETIQVIKTSDLVVDQGLYVKLIVNWSKNGEVLPRSVGLDTTAGQHNWKYTSHVTEANRVSASASGLSLGFDYINQAYGQPIVNDSVLILPGETTSAVTDGSISLAWDWATEIQQNSIGEDVTIDEVSGLIRLNQSIFINVASTANPGNFVRWVIPRRQLISFGVDSGGFIQFNVKCSNWATDMTVPELQEYLFDAATLNSTEQGGQTVKDYIYTTLHAAGVSTVTLDSAVFDYLEGGLAQIDDIGVEADSALLEEVRAEIRGALESSIEELGESLSEHVQLVQRHTDLQADIDDTQAVITAFEEDLTIFSPSELLDIYAAYIAVKEEQEAQLREVEDLIAEILVQIDDLRSSIEQLEAFADVADGATSYALLYSEGGLNGVQAYGVDLPPPSSVINEDLVRAGSDLISPNLGNFSLVAGSVTIFQPASIDVTVGSDLYNFAMRPTGILSENYWVNWTGVADSTYTWTQNAYINSVGAEIGTAAASAHPVGGVINALSRPYIMLDDTVVSVRSAQVINSSSAVTVDPCLPQGHHYRQVYPHGLAETPLTPVVVGGLYVNRGNGLLEMSASDHLLSWYIPASSISLPKSDPTSNNVGQGLFRSQTSDYVKEAFMYPLHLPLFAANDPFDIEDKTRLKFINNWDCGATSDLDTPAVTIPGGAALGPTVIDHDKTHWSNSPIPAVGDIAVSGGVHGLLCRPENVTITRADNAKRLVPFKLNFDIPAIANKVGGFHPFDMSSTNWTASSDLLDAVDPNTGIAHGYDERVRAGLGHYLNGDINLSAEQSIGKDQASALRYTYENDELCLMQLAQTRVREHVVRYSLEISVHKNNVDPRSKLVRFMSTSVDDLLKLP